MGQSQSMKYEVSAPTSLSKSVSKVNNFGMHVDEMKIYSDDNHYIY
jgi:hypothetical protein